VMKSNYASGGLKIADIECLDKSLKLRQYIKASRSSHNIAKIQIFCAESVGSKVILASEFGSITKDECVSSVAQQIMNIITDETRMNRFGQVGDSVEAQLR